MSRTLCMRIPVYMLLILLGSYLETWESVPTTSSVSGDASERLRAATLRAPVRAANRALFFRLHPAPGRIVFEIFREALNG
jgi:hypothetical protein